MGGLEDQMSREEVVVKTAYVEINNEAMYDLVCKDGSSDGSVKMQDWLGYWDKGLDGGGVRVLSEEDALKVFFMVRDIHM